jgi:hypothetical protein
MERPRVVLARAGAPPARLGAWCVRVPCSALCSLLLAKRHPTKRHPLTKVDPKRSMKTAHEATSARAVSALAARAVRRMSVHVVTRLRCARRLTGAATHVSRRRCAATDAPSATTSARGRRRRVRQGSSVPWLPAASPPRARASHPQASGGSMSLAIRSMTAWLRAPRAWCASPSMRAAFASSSRASSARAMTTAFRISADLVAPVSLSPAGTQARSKEAAGSASVGPVERKPERQLWRATVALRRIANAPSFTHAPRASCAP